MLALAFAALCLPATAKAKEYSLTPCFRAVAGGDTAEAMSKLPGGFDCATKQTRHPPGDYWVRLDAKGIQSPVSDRLSLRTPSLWIESHDIDVFYTDGKHYRLSVPRDKTSDYLKLGAQLEFPLAIHNAPIDNIVVKVSDAANVRGILLVPKLSSAKQNAITERNYSAFYSAFAGLCIALLVYNLALWRGMRSRFQIAYCAMVVALMGYAFTSSGGAAIAFPELENQTRLRLNYLLLSFSAAAAILFIRFFLEEHVLPRWFVLALWAQSGAMIGAAAAYAWLAPMSIQLLDLAYFASFVPLPLTFMVILFFAIRNRSRYTGYLLLAWSAPVAATMARNLHGLGELPYHFMLDNSSLIAMSFEAIISSLAIGQRIRLLTHERDWAREAEIIARQLADTDALTGLMNRRSFMREIGAQPGQWRLTLFDIDHFKRVNDALGHDGGDDLLCRFASLIGGLAPDNALVARLGGEEFAIATNDEDQCDAAALLKAIRSTPMIDGYHITASCGSAVRALSSDADWKLLYKEADLALYRAKTDGRDRHIDFAEASAIDRPSVAFPTTQTA